ncbi:Gfo/Idh/MocA family oxidoreductase [Paenibacillus frigoriresistens]|uniref:Gfo/Idh/MocA family protein n=1 Tax=Paenibacillus alginolyticus TaxID=59839 RepID=UPI001563CA01|nr:Gfo/Idh/MocA family oxidoreductase [Paenibacillus frigoriresistens]NRF94515.1 Gfo/Idh/MocA family oxidoreductase [Paenibacillus frigoriresistens]
MIQAALIGAGNRGRLSYGVYAKKRPNEIRFTAVADSDEEKRRLFGEQHGIPLERQFASWEDMLDVPNLCDAVVICTPDHLHFEPAMKTLEKKYHLLLEKPIAPSPDEVIKLQEAADQAGKLMLICHVLRYTTYFKTLKKLLEEKAIGRTVSVQWNENVGFWHYAHSYVRGNWRNTKQSSPMLLAKCCHDVDLLHWLIDSDVTRVSSFGDLAYFKKENAPVGATVRCTDGCAVENECPYSAIKQYYNEKTTFPQNIITIEPTLEARWKAITEGPYGRCVYHCDNDVVDHQVVNFEFANGSTVAFTMTGLTNDNTRTFKFMGTKGEIRGHLEKNEIEIISFNGRREIIRPEGVEGGHGGGDFQIMSYFIRHLQEVLEGKKPISTSAAVNSHMSVFAAEHSRLTGNTVRMDEYLAEIKRRAISNES